MLALKGLKVLDLTRLTPGNFCSMLLGDLGADVLKIEEPGRGDYIRWSPPVRNEQSIYFTIYNRNKRSVTLNLKKEEGRAILSELIQKYDIILESSRPGVARRLGVDYESLAKINESLIYCSLTGYGQDGPYRDRPGHDLNYLAVSGLLHLSGLHSSDPPAPPGIPLADLTGALYAVIGIQAAVINRFNTGKGQYIDVAMLDSLLPFLGLEAPKLFVMGQNISRGQTFPGGEAGNTVFTTKDNKYITLVIFEDHHWENFCHAINRDDLLKMDFRKTKEKSELYPILKEVFMSKTKDEWVEILRNVNTCFEPVLDLKEAFNHPQILHREMILETEHPTEGKVKEIGFPVKFSRTPTKHYRHSPRLGEHTEEVLREFGYTEEKICVLRESGVT